MLFDGMPFGVREAKEAGINPKALRDLVRTRQVRHVLREVYQDAIVPDSLTSRAACLRLCLPVGAALSGETAAWLYGVDVRSPGEQQRPLLLECSVPRGREPLSRPGIRCGVAELVADVDVVDGLLCTTPSRTAVDLLRRLRPHMGLAVADALAHARLLEPEELPGHVERFKGGRGIVQARRLAALVDALSESFGESWLRLRILDAGFPRPTAQIWVPEAGYRLDLGWKKLRVAVEYDGEEFHGSPAQQRHDGARRDELSRFGWLVVGVGRGEVLGRSLVLERGVGELLGLEPKIRRRLW